MQYVCQNKNGPNARFFILDYLFFLFYVPLFNDVFHKFNTHQVFDINQLAILCF